MGEHLKAGILGMYSKMGLSFCRWNLKAIYNFSFLGFMRKLSKSGKKEIWQEIGRCVLVLKLANASEWLNKGVEVIVNFSRKQYYEYFSSVMTLLFGTF